MIYWITDNYASIQDTFAMLLMTASLHGRSTMIVLSADNMVPEFTAVVFVFLDL
jgi:hypothetical protein